MAQRATDAQANAYFEECVANPHPVFTDFNEFQAFCACTASKIPEFLSQQQIRDMRNLEGRKGQKAYDRFLKYAMAPCMEIPVQSFISQECRQNPNIISVTPDPEALCHCVDTRVTLQMRSEAIPVMREVIHENPMEPDPISAFLASSRFTEYNGRVLALCIRQDVREQRARHRRSQENSISNREFQPAPLRNRPSLTIENQNDDASQTTGRSSNLGVPGRN